MVAPYLLYAGGGQSYAAHQQPEGWTTGIRFGSHWHAFDVEQLIEAICTAAFPAVSRFATLANHYVILVLDFPLAVRVNVVLHELPHGRPLLPPAPLLLNAVPLRPNSKLVSTTSERFATHASVISRHYIGE